MNGGNCLFASIETMPKSKANSNGNSSNEIYQQIDSLSAIEKKVINSMQPFMDHEDFTAQVRTIMKAAGLLTDKVCFK